MSVENIQDRIPLIQASNDLESVCLAPVWEKTCVRFLLDMQRECKPLRYKFPGMRGFAVEYFSSDDDMQRRDYWARGVEDGRGPT